jgi:MFS family permease
MLAETMFYGLLWAITATYLDNIGTSFLLWEYPYTIIPMESKNLSANLTSIPIAFMLVYQYYPKLKTFTWATITISFLFGFVFEPILVWLGIYRLYHWTFYYSFLLYIIFSLVFRWITKKLFAIQSRHRK